ncbi:DUF1612 domain-containing protein [Mesorhizobium sp. M0309]|uniref:DUF1612 domain-containing protein n=1 Tax=Mesorhizobium sp. M0309 TaxID=2956933 RepID=UPI00333C2ECB
MQSPGRRGKTSNRCSTSTGLAICWWPHCSGNAARSARILLLSTRGPRLIARERRNAPVRTTRLVAVLDAYAEAAAAGLKELDRLVLAKGQMERRLRNRRIKTRACRR